MQSKGTDAFGHLVVFRYFCVRMQAERQNPSDVWTLSHLFSLAKECDMIWIQKFLCIHSTHFFYKHKVHKHTQPQIQEILSTLLSTPPASDFEIDNKISEKLLLFPKIIEKNYNLFSKF